MSARFDVGFYREDGVRTAVTLAVTGRTVAGYLRDVAEVADLNSAKWRLVVTGAGNPLPLQLEHV